VSFWNKVKAESQDAKKAAGQALDAAKLKAAESKIVYGDAFKRGVGTLPPGHKVGLAAGLGLTVLALGGAAFFAGRLAKVEPEAASGLKKAADLLSSFLAKALAK